jgi:hypothetical protein
MESSRRVGYHDFKAYTERLARGKYQGFVLVRHHTLVGAVQSVFRAGQVALEEREAFSRAEGKVVELMRLVSVECRRTRTE